MLQNNLEAQGMVEYALIVALIAIVAAVGFGLFGSGLLDEYNSFLGLPF